MWSRGEENDERARGPGEVGVGSMRGGVGVGRRRGCRWVGIGAEMGGERMRGREGWVGGRELEVNRRRGKGRERG